MHCSNLFSHSSSIPLSPLISVMTTLLIIFFLVSIHLGPTIAAENGALRDRQSLLGSISSITTDPEGALANWGSSNIHMCNWTGVTCHHKHRVVQLELSQRGLTGTISAALANLSFLAVLDLSNNLFTGSIPVELGALSGLKKLSLAGNFLHGSVPEELGFLHKLIYLDLSGNQLTGPIAESLLCNCTSLQYLDLSNNTLGGEIPLSNQCKLDDLMYLHLWGNYLEGPIRPSLSNFTALKWIDLEANSLTGELPAGIFDKFPYLIFLHLSFNNFSSSTLDPLFSSLRNCSYLQELEIAGNNLGGVIPPSIGDISVNLHRLDVEGNLLCGPIPPNILNLVNLTFLNLSHNSLNGSVVSDISRLRRLESLYLSNNLFSGDIPPSLGELPHLGLVDMSRNMLSGSIPEKLSNLFQLRRLVLHNNNLSGSIPPTLGSCVNLELLDLSYNKLTGKIPTSVAGLTGLHFYLNLSSNFLVGPLPIELSKLDMILALDISSNNLSGSIPTQIGSCIALEYLNLSSNALTGNLPSSIGVLPSLGVLDLSENQLTGVMPGTLQASLSLRQLNLSFNNFSGVIPTGGLFALLSEDSFLGNPGLCGPILGSVSCNKRRPAHRLVILPIIVTLICSSSCLVVCAFAYPRVRRSRKRSQSTVLHRAASIDGDEGQIKRDYPRISHRQLVEATEGFSYSNLIGSGRFGNVYKGILPNDMRIAVKVLNPKTGFVETSTSFKRECDVLKRTRHRNLIKIITTCNKPDFKAIVLPLMPNGNLDSHLYPSDGSTNRLSFVQLVSIVSDIAEGIAYLHHYSPVQVVHCDLKPSNVLLDENLTAVVADFGIARFAEGEGSYASSSSGNIDDSASCISPTGLLYGSVGYIAPEYGLGGQASVQGDVYSFGVLLLEIITGKRPTDVLFDEGLTLQEWVKSTTHQYQYYPNSTSVESIISQPPNINMEEDLQVQQLKKGRDVMMKLIELGLVCTHLYPSVRPNMIDVAHEIAVLKAHFLRQTSTTPAGNGRLIKALGFGGIS